MKRILHADDDPDDVLILKRAFKRAGLPHRYEAVNDGATAIEWLSGQGSYADREKHPLPDVLILDLEMPRRTGYEVLDWCRHHKEFQLLPVLILSSSDEVRDIKKAYDLGATSYFIKSSSCSEVVHYLRDQV